MSDHDESGDFAKGNQASVGLTHSRKATPEHKAYTQAVRELLADRAGDGTTFPASWPKDRKDWTNAQKLAGRHLQIALGGGLNSMDVANMMINRAEGKIPTAPEDRASTEKAAANLGAGFTALQMLREALRLRPVEITDVEVGPILLPPVKK